MPAPLRHAGAPRNDLADIRRTSGLEGGGRGIIAYNRSIFAHSLSKTRRPQAHRWRAAPRAKILPRLQRHSAPLRSWHRACDGPARGTLAPRPRANCDHPPIPNRDRSHHDISQTFPADTCCKAAPRRALAATLPGAPAFAADTVVGFVYVGSRDDYGYNQAHAAGAAALKKMAGIKVVEEEKVPETDAVEKTMESMINLDGATLLFPTSYGYFSPHVLKLANKYPKVRFEHAGGLWTDKDPKNVGSYFGYIDEAQYVAGIVAGAFHQDRQARLRRRQADPAAAAQRQRLHARRQARQSERDLAGHLHRRLVDAGEGSGSHQQPGRRRRRRHHLPRRRAEDRDGERRAPRRHDLELSRQRGAACAAGPSHRRRVELGGALSALRADVSPRARPSRTSIAAASRKASSRSRPMGRRSRRRRASRPTTSRPSSPPAATSIFKGPLKDNKGNTVIARRRRARPDRPRAREDELSGGRRDRRDVVTADACAGSGAKLALCATREEARGGRSCHSCRSGNPSAEGGAVVG